MNQLAPLLKNSTPKAKIGLAAGVVVTLVVFFLLFKMATAPSYETLLTGVDPAETGKITKALDEQGLKYEIQNGGTAIAVLPADTAMARIALAEQGLPGKGQPGFELFDKQKMGTSDFQQQVNYQRALEGEIASTIEQVQGVSGAKVRLVLPEDQLFAEDKKPATAAVLLAGESTSLDPSAVRGMAQLVSSSVEGLALDKVTITDGTGALLWPKDGADSAGGGSATTKLQAEQRYNQDLEARLGALLAGTVGADKARVQVASTLNVDKATERKLTYDRRGVPLRTSEETERLRGGNGGRAGGAAGTASNVPGYAGAAGGAGGDSNYNRRSGETEFGVGRTVRDTEFAPGTVERQQVAVVLDQSVPPAVASQVQQAVASAAGIDAGRGDKITVSRVAFAKETTEEPKVSPVETFAAPIKWGALGLATLLFLFFVTRAIRKREREALGEPVWLREITAPQPLAALEAAEAPTQVVAKRTNDVRRKAEQLAQQQPEKVAQQVRSWMQEEG
jgi:flagellar M-ring protein FliF